LADFNFYTKVGFFFNTILTLQFTVQQAQIRFNVHFRKISFSFFHDLTFDLCFSVLFRFRSSSFADVALELMLAEEESPAGLALVSLVLVLDALPAVRSDGFVLSAQVAAQAFGVLELFVALPAVERHRTTLSVFLQHRKTSKCLQIKKIIDYTVKSK